MKSSENSNEKNENKSVKKAKVAEKKSAKKRSSSAAADSEATEFDSAEADGEQDDDSLAAEGRDSDDADEQDDGLDENVKKLIQYAQNKQFISWDEINEILTPEYVNSPKMDNVLQLLPKYNIQIMEEADSLLDEEESEEEDELDESA